MLRTVISTSRPCKPATLVNIAAATVEKVLKISGGDVILVLIRSVVGTSSNLSEMAKVNESEIKPSLNFRDKSHN